MSAKIYMRATRYAPKRCRFPAWVQPKHNGIRFIWDGHVGLSREGNAFPGHIQQMLQEAWPDTPKTWKRDGEIIFPLSLGRSLQQTVSAVKHEQKDSKDLVFPVFDGIPFCFNSDVSFRDRQRIVSATTETHKVFNLRDVEHWYETFLADGEEGLIFRTDTPYIFGSGSYHLMKEKPVKHAEFLIIDVWEGRGKNKGTPVYRLLRPDCGCHPEEWDAECMVVTAKNSFGAVPEGAYEHKRQMWNERADAVGKMLTVHFWDYYDSGVPQFPIAEAVRDYE